MARARELHDRYFRQAKAEGYLARSAYKLKQIDDRKRLIRRGDRVLDLGCAPGSWLQVASELVGPRGVVVGLDLQEVEGRDRGFAPNVRALQGDIFKAPAEDLTTAAGGMFHVVLSDMAPNTTGAGDHFRSVELCRRILELLPMLLRPGGHLAMKVFEGEEYPALLRETARRFNEAKGYKPEATREVSREMYIIGKEYKGPSAPARRDAPRPPTAARPPEAPA
jgi:23S rRNA (uridine2552-2'-O)-methyltransferase